MIFLKEDGSLDVEQMLSLPLEEFIDVVGDMSQDQWDEFITKSEPYMTEGPIVPIVDDRPIEEIGIDADELLNNLRGEFLTEVRQS